MGITARLSFVRSSGFVTGKKYCYFLLKGYIQKIRTFTFVRDSSLILENMILD